MRSRRPFARLVTLVAAGAAGFAASWAGLDVSLSRVTTAALSADQSRSWAPLPEEVPMPAAAPDDPMAYRGVRFRMLDVYSGDSVEAGGQEVPGLRGYAGNVRVTSDGSYFGDHLMVDGRRRMKWFVRLVEPPWQPVERTRPGPLMAVLDVLVLPDEPRHGDWRRGCGPDDEVNIVDDDGWRLNRSTGSLEPTDPDDAVCPED